MPVLIKNPDTERKIREVASLHGETLTGAVDRAMDRELAAARPPKRRTAEEILAAAAGLREEAGVWEPLPPMTKADWDEINEVPGFPEDDD
ncbi:MAG: type II toxin-antitoxin system VapB family antitoxin [Phenylobacterium sp.]|jgi:antitoxin VapB